MTRDGLEPEPGRMIPGRPGYRTRDGFTGLDPLDTYREVGYMEGRFFKALLTGRLRTRNPWYLTLMFAAGLALTSPLLCSIAEVLSGYPPTLLYMPGCLTLSAGVFVVMGAVLFVNFALCVRTLCLQIRESSPRLKRKGANAEKNK